jgi:hypothetical protein
MFVSIVKFDNTGITRRYVPSLVARRASRAFTQAVLRKACVKRAPLVMTVASVSYEAAVRSLTVKGAHISSTVVAQIGGLA